MSHWDEGVMRHGAGPIPSASDRAARNGGEEYRYSLPRIQTYKTQPTNHSMPSASNGHRCAATSEMGVMGTEMGVVGTEMGVVGKATHDSHAFEGSDVGVSACGWARIGRGSTGQHRARHGGGHGGGMGDGGGNVMATWWVGGQGWYYRGGSAGWYYVVGGGRPDRHPPVD